MPDSKPTFDQLDPDEFAKRLAEAYEKFWEMAQRYRPTDDPAPRHVAIMQENVKMLNLLQNVAYGTIVLYPGDSERILYHIMIAVELAFTLGYETRREEETYTDAERLVAGINLDVEE